MGGVEVGAHGQGIQMSPWDSLLLEILQWVPEPCFPLTCMSAQPISYVSK